MIEVKDINLPLDGGLKKAAAKKLHMPESNIKEAVLLRRGIDARKKTNVHFVATAALSLKKGEEGYPVYVPYKQPELPHLSRRPVHPPVVCGAGPAGLFAALTLSRAGLCPILLERGDSVDKRAEAVKRFHTTGILDTQSNVQFGEGGAGTFSDGKLNSGTHDPRSRQVLQDFVRAGAPEQILWEAKPHIGTDKLPQTVRGLRDEIISLGGEVRFRTQLTALVLKDGRLTAVKTDRGDIETENLILATGHSARDTFAMLALFGVRLEQKPFSMGVRIEHPQQLINESQYGPFASHPALGAADYKLAVHLPSGRGVYTFCMCPGGDVVAASSEAGRLCVNGMSVFARNGVNANSAVLVNVDPSDFGSTDPLAGVALQRKWEEAAFAAGGRNYTAPAQLVGDFLRDIPSNSGGCVHPTYPLGVNWTDLRYCLPGFIAESIKEGLPLFDNKLRGFAMEEAVLTGIEARSSSPVRITRDEQGQSNIPGIYPCGEGAGYAGGILSAAVDGIRQAEKLLEQFL